MTTQKHSDELTIKKSRGLSQDTKRGRSSSIALGKLNLLLSLLGLLFLAGAYWLTLLPEALALLILTLSLLTGVARSPGRARVRSPASSLSA
jgi:hypothetical protein